MSPKTKVSKINDLLNFDRDIKYGADGQLRIETMRLIGVDEVGRGCLAGPVVACAVEFTDFSHECEVWKLLKDLDDSKKLPASVREEISAHVKQHARFALGECSPTEIDNMNILNASLLAMFRALKKLDPHISSTVVLVDGNKKIPKFKGTQHTVIGGDARSASIAAASVVAKVHRDAFMKELAQKHTKFEPYAWHSNKGYGSKVHRDAIKIHGTTKWHRMSFNLDGNAEEQGEDSENQNED
ncbi:MAG: ribonuclease HII [Candidatus Melainabacteria bacterium]|nr:ribonuclease HII [Candidatus Melainabacteria bacterium]